MKINSRIAYIIFSFFGAATLIGCGARGETNPNNIDAIYLTPEQERDVFIGQTRFGPEHSVIVLAQVPQVRYENGAIVLTGGREMEIVQPHAWREFTGTAVTVEEARRLVARAERLEQNISDMAVSAANLKSFLQDRSDIAHRQVKNAQEAEIERRQEQERQRIERMQALSKVEGWYEMEIEKVKTERDIGMKSMGKERDDAIDEVGKKHADAVISIADEFARREITANGEYEKRIKAVNTRKEIDLSIARNASKGEKVIEQMVDGYNNEIARIEKERKNSVEVLKGDRDRDMAKTREAANLRISDLRQLYEHKIEGLRSDAAAKIQKLQEQQREAGMKKQPEGEEKPKGSSVPVEAGKKPQVGEPVVEKKIEAPANKKGE